MQFLKLLKTSFLFLFFSTIILGIIYPLFIYLLGSSFFPNKAKGSFIYKNNTVIGSKLIGQEFVSDKYFHSRPSRKSDPYNPLMRNISYGPTSLKLKDLIEKDAKLYEEKNATPKAPADAICASSSGIDPDISLENAYLQAPRIAKARNISTEEVNKLIKKYRSKKFLGIIGEKRVNVLKLNLALDKY